MRKLIISILITKEDDNVFVYEHSISVQVSAEKIWGLYMDVKAWNCWDESLESARCVGGLAPGAVRRYGAERWYETALYHCRVRKAG